jgi:rfaE bifunctional protein nucleotidyltransferase chain/domain
VLTVLANGCFDLLHVGHVRHLIAARAMGDRLVVALTVDEAVRKGPGRPIVPWEDRAEMLLSLRCVDEVVPSESAFQAILAVRPRIFVKGIDYADSPALDDDREACKTVGAELRLTDTPKNSSTELIKRIAKCASA